MDVFLFIKHPDGISTTSYRINIPALGKAVLPFFLSRRFNIVYCTEKEKKFYRRQQPLHRFAF